MTYKCKYCKWVGFRKDFEIDHVIPIARSILQNILQPALDLICSGCNRQKGKMTGAEYRLWRLLNPYRANSGPII
ncbi:MAG: HNH endonuclease [Candidatus Daviesbacteria bacterium]|nr:MAG: HNH endonuclease [Candidatus Daviesbacteria bacterium]